jgi:hypothetical protein
MSQTPTYKTETETSKHSKSSRPDKSVGRPVKFIFEEWGPKICDRLVCGESLVRICKTPGWPSYTLVLQWLRADHEFRHDYGLSRIAQADFLADEIIEIADNCKDPQTARVQIDVRKWMAARLNPKRYGDKVDFGHSGEVDVTVRIGGDKD